MDNKPLAALTDWGLAGWQKMSFQARQLTASKVTPDSWRNPGAPQVLLLPGVWEKWSSLIHWADALSADAWDVAFAPAVDLELGSLPDLAERLAPSLNNFPLIVAHSKGGLVAKQAMIDSPGLIRGLIAVGTPFGGSPLARMLPRVSGMADLTPENEELTAVGSERASSGRTVLIEAQWDQDVPTSGRHAAGSYCMVPVTGHNALLDSPIVADKIRAYAAHIRDNWEPQ